ncbi:MAG TPA: BatA and WFA domain-containing protein [bacterium]|nr:BatA and WFA domain-containing protein [bacterium]
MSSLYFASPWFFLGLVSLIIPFLLLLSRAAPQQTIHFSSVEFLVSITKRASSVIQWKKIFLLICRLAMLCLLVLGFALPFLKKGGSLFGNRSGQHLVFVLDNSYSMGYAEKEKPSLFEQAKQKITESVKAHPKAVYSLFLFNSKLEPAVIQTSDGPLFHKNLEQANISELGSVFPILLPSLAKHFPSERKKQLEFLIFSDFSIPDREARNAFKAEVAKNQKKRNLKIIPIQPERFRNFLIREIEMPFRPFLPGTKEAVRIFYEAYGYKPGEEIEISLMSEGIFTQKQKIIIPGSLKGSVFFDVDFPSADRFPLRIESGVDGLPLDNVRYAAVFVHAPLNLLFVEDSTHNYPFDRPIFYFDHALQSSVDPERPWLNLESANISDLGSLPLENYDFVVLADITDWQPRVMNQFKAYVKKGGAVLVAFGKNWVNQPLPEGLSQALTQFLGGQVGEVIKKKTGSPAHLEPVDYAQPFLQVFEGGKQGNLQRINFWKFVSLMPLESGGVVSKGGGGDGKTLLWFDSKWPALVQKKMGSGTLLVWTSSLNHEWTDFPKNSLYVPFVLELLKSVALPKWGKQLNLKVGEPIVFADILANNAGQVLMKDPKGESIAIYAGAGSLIPSFSTHHAGFYEWTARGLETQERNLVACNIDPRESRPGYIRWNAKILGPEKEAAPSVPGGETGVIRHFMYRPLFYTIFLLLLLEAWVANQMYKPKWV